MRKGLRYAIALASVAAFALPLTPSSAANTIVGTVTGNVTITSPAAGIPLDGTCVDTSYDFSGVAIEGTLTDGTSTVNGTVGVSGVKGGSNAPVDPLCTTAKPESINGAKGNVNAAPITGIIPPANQPATFSGTSISSADTVVGRFWGSYTRDHTIVTVSLSVQFCFNRSLGSCFPKGVWHVDKHSSAQTETVSVTAQFTPSGLDPTFSGVKTAVFQGSFNN